MKKTIIILINIMFVLGIVAFNPRQVLAGDEVNEVTYWSFGLVYNHSPMYTGTEELMARIIGREGSREPINLSDYGEFTTRLNQKGTVGFSLELYSPGDFLLRATYALLEKTEFRGYYIQGYSHETHYSIGAMMLNLEFQKDFPWNHSKTFITGLGGGLNIYRIKLNEEHNNESSVNTGLFPFLSISQRLMLMKGFWVEIGYKRSLLQPEYEFSVDSDLWSDWIEDRKKSVRGPEIEKSQFLIRLLFRF